MTGRGRRESVLEALAQWEAIVAATSRADVNQLSVWARLHGTVGYQPLYIRVWRDVLVWRGSDLVAGAQICIDASPCWSGGYLPYGPLIAPRRLANDVSNARPGVTTRTSKRAAGK